MRYMKLLSRFATPRSQPQQVFRQLLTDPDDPRIFTCAVAGSAKLIVLGDRDLRHLRIYEAIIRDTRGTHRLHALAVYDCGYWLDTVGLKFTNSARRFFARPARVALVSMG